MAKAATGALEPLAAQVAGHPGSVLASESGDVIVKPSLPLERAFYTSLASQLGLEGFVPRFYGTLQLQGKLPDGQAGLDPAAAVDASQPLQAQLGLEDAKGQGPDEGIVLENLTNRFVRPNVIDIKLGTQFWDEQSSADKRKRMEEASAATTSGTTGVRLTGFQVRRARSPASLTLQVWSSTSQSYVATPKSYGKSIKVSELADGARKMFPVAAADTGGLPSELLKRTLELIVDRARAIRDRAAPLEWRVRGGSVLIVYEGDAEALQRALDDPLDPDEEEESDEEGEADDARPKRTLAYDVRLIDFAHTTHVPGQGPDEGYNLGLRTAVALLEARLAELS